MEVESFRDLRTWQEARRLVIEIYRITDKFPVEERYRLVAQIRAAAVSVAANIAEGMGRGSLNDLCRFIKIARGSVQEMISHLILSGDLGYISQEEAKTLVSRYDGLCRGINII
jgi:four helix bundle protein